jgi:hypothetical protein
MPELIPDLPLTLELDPALAEALDLQSVAPAVEAAVAAIGSALGVPMRPQAHITLGPLRRTPPPYALARLSVDGVVCRHRDDLAQRTYELLAGQLRSAAMSDEALLAWLASDRGRALAFVATLCAEMVKARPSVLLTQPIAAALAERLASVRPDQARAGALRAAMAPALDLWIGLRDGEAGAAALRALASGPEADDPAGAGAEALIAALRPNVIEVRMPRQTLREQTLSATDDDQALFGIMREGLFHELGLHYPAFRFVADESLAPGTFALGINHLTTLPQRILAPGEYMADVQPEQLAALGIHGRAARHPVQLRTVAIIDAAAYPTALAAGAQVYTPVGYLIMCLSHTLRQHSERLVDTRLAAALLRQLEVSLPVPVRALHETLPLHRFTAVLRLLLAEGIPIRNLRAVVEGVLHFDTIPVPHNLIAFDERLHLSTPPGDPPHPALIVAYVRSTLRRFISYRHTIGMSSLRVYLLSLDLEAEIIAGDPGPNAARLLDLLREALAALPPDTPPPAILTTIEARAGVRHLLAPECADVPVLAYQELIAELTVEPVGRLE